jgi:DNA repair exonuclease SbcCD nuclease subunit
LIGLRSDLNLLVTHQAFDQATVGPADFTFHAGRQDTVSRHTIPTDFDYIAAGHIHRYQVLAHPLKPGLSIVYPGSIQRMSFAEWDEDKGFVGGETRGGRIETRFVPLPAYDMEMVEIEAAGLTTESFLDVIRGQFWRFSDDRVIRFTLTGGEKSTDYPSIDFKTLRREMPDVLECQFVKKVGKKAIVCNS